MKKMKKLIFLFMILFLSGCSVEYNVTINEDNTISETVIAKEKTNRMESLTNLKDKQAVTYLYNMFKRENEDIKFNYSVDDTHTSATAYTSHKNIDEYANKFSSDIFKKIVITKDNDIITLTANQDRLLGENSSYTLIYDNIKVNIEIPYEVTYNNADSINGNIYTWNIYKSEDFKNIKISYNKYKKKNNINIKISDKSYNINYGIVMTGGIILIIGLIIVFVNIKNKKNNSV